MPALIATIQTFDDGRHLVEVPAMIRWRKPRGYSYFIRTVERHELRRRRKAQLIRVFSGLVGRSRARSIINFWRFIWK